MLHPRSELSPRRVELDPAVVAAVLALGHAERTVAFIADELRRNGVEHAGPGPEGHRQRQMSETIRTALPLIRKRPNDAAAKGAEEEQQGGSGQRDPQSARRE